MVTRAFRLPLFAVLLLFSFPLSWGQAGGKSQLHFIDVGLGDGAILHLSGRSGCPVRYWSRYDRQGWRFGHNNYQTGNQKPSR
jgi:hypothetical protein